MPLIKKEANIMYLIDPTVDIYLNKDLYSIYVQRIKSTWKIENENYN